MAPPSTSPSPRSSPRGERKLSRPGAPMPEDSEYIVHILDLLRRWAPVAARRMFGGHGLFRGGLMFGLVADDALYFKTDDGKPRRLRGGRHGPPLLTPAPAAPRSSCPITRCRPISWRRARISPSGPGGPMRRRSARASRNGRASRAAGPAPGGAERISWGSFPRPGHKIRIWRLGSGAGQAAISPP